MPPQVIKFAVIGIGALVLLALVWPSGPTEDELAVEQRIEGFALAVEQGNRDAFEAGLAPDFTTSGRYLSHYKRSMAVDRVFQIVSGFERVDVQIRDLECEVNSDTATAKASFHVGLEGDGTPRSVSSDQIRHSKVNLTLRRYGAQWLVVRAGIGYNAFAL